ncbi:MAG: aminotransferase class III-fold pyridoxal phosphate-dependent enzyme [Nanopusillaceae archaeon]
MSKTTLSEHYYKYIGGGRQHPLPYPIFYPKYIKRAKDVFIWSYDGKKFIDLWMGFGSVILGYNNKKFNNEIFKQFENGHLFSGPSVYEKELYLYLKKFINLKNFKIKYSITGSQSVQLAINIAREYTKKKYIIVLGAYHGMNETISSKKIIRGEINLPIDKIKKIIKNKDVAAIVLEPILTNKGLIKSKSTWIEELYELCVKNDIILISDETVTGFRVSPGFVIEKIYKISSDIMIGSKSLGNGIPFSMVIGEEKIMDLILPIGRVFFGGTYFGNVVSLKAAITTLKILDKKGFLILERITHKLIKYLQNEIEKFDLSLSWVPGMFWIYFAENKIPDRPSQIKTFLHEKLYYSFTKECISQNLFVPSSPYEPFFVSLSHKGYEKLISNILIDCIERVMKDKKYDDSLS